MSQTLKLLNLLQDGRPHRTDEIMAKVYGNDHLGLARVGARIWDLKKKGNDIRGWKDENNHALYYYQLIIPQPVIAQKQPERPLQTSQISLFH